MVVLGPLPLGMCSVDLLLNVLGPLLREIMGALLSPLQLPYGTPRCAEIVVHSGLRYLSNLTKDHLMFKLDFMNAFNSIR